MDSNASFGVSWACVREAGLLDGCIAPSYCVCGRVYRERACGRCSMRERRSPPHSFDMGGIWETPCVMDGWPMHRLRISHGIAPVLAISPVDDFLRQLSFGCVYDLDENVLERAGRDPPL